MKSLCSVFKLGKEAFYLNFFFWRFHVHSVIQAFVRPEIPDLPTTISGLFLYLRASLKTSTSSLIYSPYSVSSQASACRLSLLTFSPFLWVSLKPLKLVVANSNRFVLISSKRENPLAFLRERPKKYSRANIF